MGGIIGDIGKLFGGSGAKTDRKAQLAGYGGLENVFNFGIGQGEEESGQASQLLNQAGNYYTQLLGGNRQATLSAVAPTVNAATAQTDATKRAISTSGTARGGGSNATTLGLEDQKRAAIDNAIASAKTGAASGATSTGGTMASQASSLLGLGETAASNLSSIASGSRDESDALHNEKVSAGADLGDKVAQIIASLFGGGGWMGAASALMSKGGSS